MNIKKYGRVAWPIVFVVSIAFGIALAATGWGEIKLAVSNMRWWFLLCLPPIMLFNGSLSSYLWMWQFRLLGEKVSFFPVFRENIYAAITRFIPVTGKALNIGGHVYYFSQMGVGARSVYLASVMDLACSGVAATLVGLWLLVGWVPWWVLGGMVGGAMAILHPKILNIIAGWVLKKKGVDGQILISCRNILLLWCGYIMVWVSSGIIFYLLALTFHPIGLNRLPMIAAANAAGWVLGYITIILPMGLGVWDGVLLLTFKTMVPIGVALAITVACRLLSIFGEFLMAGGIFIYDNLVYKK